MIERLCLGQANGLLEAKVEMMRDNLTAARADASAKVALEREVTSLKEQLAEQSSRPQSADQDAVQERPVSAEEGKQHGKSPAELEKELESLQQTNKLLTDQIRSLQVSAFTWPSTMLIIQQSQQERTTVRKEIRQFSRACAFWCSPSQHEYRIMLLTNCCKVTSEKGTWIGDCVCDLIKPPCRSIWRLFPLKGVFCACSGKGRCSAAGS